MTKISFPVEKFGDFLSKLEAVNKRLQRKGSPLFVVVEHVEHIKNIDDVGNTRKWVEITLEGPKTMKVTCEFVGSITFVEGVKQIFSLDAADVSLGSIPADRLVCDHCKVNRFRVKYFFFRSEGKLLSIGSSCAKDYFGWNIEAYLDAYNIMIDASFALQEDEGFGGRGSRLTFLNDMILATYVASEGFKATWISKSNTDYAKVPTSIIINSVLFPGKSKVIAEAKAEAAKLLDDTYYAKVQDKLIEKFGDVNPSNDFEFNIQNNLFDAEGLREFVVSPGIVGYAIYSAMHEKIESSESASSFLGVVGQKLTVEVRVLETKKIDTQYGQSLLLVMETPDGNIVKSFSTAAFAYNVIVGSTYKVTGTVKSHDMFNGKNSTMLTRIKG